MKDTESDTLINSHKQHIILTITHCIDEQLNDYFKSLVGIRKILQTA